MILKPQRLTETVFEEPYTDFFVFFVLETTLLQVFPVCNVNGPDATGTASFLTAAVRIITKLWTG